MSFSSSSSSHHGNDAAMRYSRSPGGYTPLSASPRPGSAPFSRPQWPWTSGTGSQHRSSNSTQTVVAPIAITLPNESETAHSAARWQQHPQHLEVPEPEASTRQWTFTAFEWTIKHVSALRDHVETASELDQPPIVTNGAHAGADEDGVPLVLKQSPMIGENGENKFKVEIARTQMLEERSSTPTGSSLSVSSVSPTAGAAVTLRVPTLSLYITSLFLDFAHPEYEFCSAIMVAIKSQEDRAGERGARSDWVWESWDNEFVFRKGSEFWECQLPPLSSLLTHPKISTRDSFVMCIQIHSPIGFYPQFPAAYYVPRDLLEGLEASLDNPHTGDVRFVTLEWLDPARDGDSEEFSGAQSRRSSSSSSPSGLPMARKRVLYAHSDILKRRSDYFATMLASAFAESTPATYPNHTDPLHPPRKIYDIIVSEADFLTIYWLLKWTYADFLMFKDNDDDDPRAVMNSMGGGWSVKSLAPASGLPGQSEWDWRPLQTNRRRPSVGGEPPSPDARDDEDLGVARSVRSVSSIGTSGAITESDEQTPVIESKGKMPVYSSTTSTRGGSSSTASSRGGRTTAHPASRGNATQASASLTQSVRRPSGPPSAKPPTISVPPNSNPSASSASNTFSVAATAAARSSVSPNRPRYPSNIHNMTPTVVPDPHPHPTPELPPASALAIYQIAHRYSLPGLQSLALDHMMNTITPKSAFPLLLASHFWEDLHGLIEDFIVEHFDAVSRCEVFDHCCEEIASGEWGPEGGKSLAALFRRLTSPQALRYNRA